MSATLLSHINVFVPLSKGDEQKISDLVTSLPVAKKEFVLKEGQVCKGNFFIVKGCVRMYFINEKGAERITQFAIENWWIADYMSLIKRTPSQFYIQAIENTTLVVMDAVLQEKLLVEVPSLEKYFRLVLQHAYAAAQHRIKYLYDYSKEDAYHHFITNFPGFAQRIPQYMVASYLGLTPEYLSEIRKKNI